MIKRRDLAKALRNKPAIVIRLTAVVSLLIAPILILITLWQNEKEDIKKAYKDTFELLYAKIEKISKPTA
jgi:hypothetical protein